MNGLEAVFFLVAFLYGMVGLGGGSAYVALLTFTGIPHVSIAPTALFLDIFVTLIGFSFYKKHLDIRAHGFFLTALYGTSLSGTWMGAYIHLPPRIFYIILGGTLVGAALLSWGKHALPSSEISLFTFKRKILLTGASFCIGLLAGIVGVGGGIFLAPLLLLAGFPPKGIAGITSLYILLNASSGFIAHYLQGHILLKQAFPYAIAVSAGSLLGAYLGSRKLHPRVIRHALTALIFFIGLKILMTHI